MSNQFERLGGMLALEAILGTPRDIDLPLPIFTLLLRSLRGLLDSSDANIVSRYVRCPLWL